MTIFDGQIIQICHRKKQRFLDFLSAVRTSKKQKVFARAMNSRFSGACRHRAGCGPVGTSGKKIRDLRATISGELKLSNVDIPLKQKIITFIVCDKAVKHGKTTQSQQGLFSLSGCVNKTSNSCLFTLWYVLHFCSSIFEKKTGLCVFFVLQRQHLNMCSGISVSMCICKCDWAAAASSKWRAWLQ